MVEALFALLLFGDTPGQIEALGAPTPRAVCLFKKASVAKTYPITSERLICAPFLDDKKNDKETIGA